MMFIHWLFKNGPSPSDKNRRFNVSPPADPEPQHTVSTFSACSPSKNQQRSSDMQNIPDGQWEEHGCFVYRVLRPVAVRTIPDVGDEHKTGLSFETGDLVSVDFIRPSPWPGSNDGPFLRLSDCSGWIFERNDSEKCLERLVVTTGLWAFYVDNLPSGMDPRRHPFDNSPKVEPRATFEPMQLIYCDKQVTAPNGVNSYRVQGTQAWVFDKRDTHWMLLPENSVRSGLFAYQVLQAISIRSKPATDDESRTLLTVFPGELVCGDIVRESPHGNVQVPFVRLTDGSGWLFAKTKSGQEQILKEIPVEAGLWTLRVLNPVGLVLRRQPIDRCGKGDMRYKTSYTANEKVKCDRRVTSSTGVNFYRVQGTQGWLFDKRGEQAVMMLVEHNNALPTVSSPTEDAWSIDFVRSAARSCYAKELMHNSQSCVISFRTQDNVWIDVYYTTRTIETVMLHPFQGTIRLFRGNCTCQELADVLEHPRLHTRRGFQKGSYGEMMDVRTQHGPEILVEEEEDVRTQHVPELLVEEEEELRNSLLEVDKQMEKLEKKRVRLLKSLKPHDDKRALAASEMKKRVDDRNEELAEMQREVDQLQPDKRERQQQVARNRERKRQHRLTCGECCRIFSSDHARDQHCEDAHGLSVCSYCGHTFKCARSRNQHREATGHWKEHHQISRQP